MWPCKSSWLGHTMHLQKFISEMFTLPVPLGVGDFIIYREENLDSNTDQLLINITINWKEQYTTNHRGRLLAQSHMSVPYILLITCVVRFIKT
jgi:hypothetical protein